MSTKIDYKKELEAASRGMIMIHEPKLLIKLIVRTIVGKVDVKHAGMILYDHEKKSYTLNISRGETGVKIPSGFTRFNDNSPIIKLFNRKEYKPLTVKKNAVISDDINRMIWKETLINEGNGAKELLHRVSEQMEMLNTVVCVPAYFQDSLLAVLLLGAKQNGEKFEQDELDFFAALASDAAMAIRNAELFIDLKKEAQKNHELFLATVKVLGSTIEAKDQYTHGHTERVTNFSVMIAKQMNANGTAKFSQAFLENLYISGLLHDIGKIGVPESILNKKDKLTPEETKIMQNHTLRGVEILAQLSEFKDSLDGVKYHHERYDGKGYPDGLKGDSIPIIAAIISVADTFDAMTSDRPYRKGLSKQTAIEEIKKNSGIQFHPLAAKALIELFEKGEI